MSSTKPFAALVALLAVGLSVAQVSADDGTNETSTPTAATAPGSPAVLETGDGTSLDPEKMVTYSESNPNSEAIASYAREKDVDNTTAALWLDRLAALTEQANEIRATDRRFSMFKIEDGPDGHRGKLALTEARDLSVRELANIDIVDAVIAERDFLELSARLTEAAHEAGVTDATAVTYDPFEQTITVWRAGDWSRVDGAPDPADVTSGLADALKIQDPRVAGLTVEAHFEAPSQLNVHNGLKLSTSSSFWFLTFSRNECTSSFGLYYGGHGGQLTAGHCTGGGWKSNDVFNITTYWDRSRGGYKDRVVMEPNTSVSYWTYTGTTYEDMDSSDPTHIYQGAYYCEYARKNYGQRCDYIEAVNVPITDANSGITVWTTRGSITMQCSPGDSGGPVWQPRSNLPSRPAGTIEGGYSWNDQCLYLALDDQMAGTGWVLL